MRTQRFSVAIQTMQVIPLPSHQLTWVCEQSPAERLLSSWLVGRFAQTRVWGEGIEPVRCPSRFHGSPQMREDFSLPPGSFLLTCDRDGNQKKKNNHTVFLSKPLKRQPNSKKVTLESLNSRSESSYQQPFGRLLDPFAQVLQ